MRVRLVLVMIFVTGIGLAACSNSSSLTAPLSTVPPTSTPPPPPLEVGNFPDTAHGNAARAMCEQWGGLERSYYARLTDPKTTPFQLDQWFASSDWSGVRADLLGLSSDPAYAQLSTAFGKAMNGGTATIGNAKAVDASCSQQQRTGP